MDGEEEKSISKNIKSKKILKCFTIFILLLLLFCVMKIFQMQHFSVLANCKNKSLNRYGKVLLSQSWWASTEYLDKKDLVKLYFILGSTREYDPKKHHQYELDGDNLISPHIKIIRERIGSDSTDSIAWDYDNNTLYIGKDENSEEEAVRYYIDQKHAEMLHELYDKYNHIENAM